MCHTYPSIDKMKPESICVNSLKNIVHYIPNIPFQQHKGIPSKGV